MSLIVDTSQQANRVPHRKKGPTIPYMLSSPNTVSVVASSNLAVHRMNQL